MKPDPATAKIRAREDALVVEALRAAGVNVSSVFDLVNDRALSPEAVRALLNALPRLSDQWIRQGVVRALTDPAARGVAAQPLVAELKKARDFGEDSLAWAIGNALTVVADHSVLDELLQLAGDSRLGAARQTIALALSRFKHDSRVDEQLTAMLDDDATAAHALMAIRKLKVLAATDRVRTLVLHKSPLIRREAEKTLKSLSGRH